MPKCDDCGAEFDSQEELNGHRTKHSLWAEKTRRLRQVGPTDE